MLREMLVTTGLLMSSIWLSVGLSQTVDRSGGCEECKEGVWRASSGIVEVGPGDYVYTDDPKCGDDSAPEEIKKLVTALAESQVPNSSKYAGPIIDQVSSRIGQEIRRNIQGSVGQILSKYSDPRANCKVIAVTIPEGAKYTGYRLWIQGYDDGVWKRVSAGPDLAWCRFVMEPMNEKRIVYTVFKNWSHNLVRPVRLEAYFKPEENTYAPPI